MKKNKIVIYNERGQVAFELTVGGYSLRVTDAGNFELNARPVEPMADTLDGQLAFDFTQAKEES